MHPDEGWAKVYRNSPKGKLAGAIDLSTAKEIVPMRPFCFIRYNKVSKRFETKANKKSSWAKTSCTLDISGNSAASSSRTTASRTQKSKSTNSNPVTEYFGPYGGGTYVYPMYSNGDPTPQGINDNTYGSGSSSSSVNSSSSRKKLSNCPSLTINNGKWYCADTGRCGMCNGDGLMDTAFGGFNSTQCTLCGGSGKCKYCR